MAVPSPANPLKYVVNRQYNERISIRNELFTERLAKARNLFRKDLLSHYGCVNAIEFSNEGELLVSGGDDRRVLLWSVPHSIFGNGQPVAMQSAHISNIFCLGFDSTNSKIFSAGNDDNLIVHDARTGSFLTNFVHDKPVYGLSVSPQNDFVFASAGDDGRILVYDIRDSSSAEPLVLARYKAAFHAVMFNPVDPRFVATANSKEGIGLWDTRKPKECFIRYEGSNGQQSGMSVRFNSLGTKLLALRRRLPPALYAFQSEKQLCQFYHPDYYNSCTMKSCCFAGENDEYVLSGSDDFNLYMWCVPKDDSPWGKPHMVLHGHRSIVNQVRYNKQSNLIASSGVEKMVKLWTTMPIGQWNGSLIQRNNEKPRAVFSHEEYISLVHHSGQFMSHDYSHQSTQEDSRMMAFFDSLVQREIEGWDSDTITSDSDRDFASPIPPASVSPWQSPPHYKLPEPHNASSSDHSTNKFAQLSSEQRDRCTRFSQRKSSDSLGSSSNFAPDPRRAVSSRSKPNRIAQLIAEKRKKLAKMAQRQSSRPSRRYDSREKHRKRKASKSKHQQATKANSKANGASSSTRKKSLPKSLARNTSTSNLPTSDCKRTSKSSFKSLKRKLRDCRESDRDQHDCGTLSSESLDVPSTSTGITASNAQYRVIEQDSDDEVPPNNCNELANTTDQPLINILPTPLNGTHDMYINILQVPISNGNNVSLQNEVDGVSTSFDQDSDNSSIDLDIVSTPNNKFRNGDVSTPDSGIVTGPCSSSGSVNSVYSGMHCPRTSGGLNRDDYSDDPDWVLFERFKSRVKRARLNLRNDFGGDSDSN